MSLSLFSRGRRVLASALMAVVVGAVLVVAPHAQATTNATQGRLAGTDRFETAAAVADAAYPSGADVAIIANARNYPDALAGAALAGLKSAPLLLTDADALPDVTAEELDALGVSSVYILGGTVAVSQAVEDTLAESYTVTRLAGTDRYATAQAIGSEVGAANVGSVGGIKTALVATGLDFADALAGGPIAAAGPGAGVLPILLVNDDVPAATSTAISSLGIKQVILLGGTSAISTTVEAKLVAATGNPAIRYAGQNRFETATKIADAAKTTFGFPLTQALLANAFAFPDALTGGPYGGTQKAPLLLTNTSSLPTETSTWLTNNRSTVATVTALGGTAVITSSVLDAAQTAATSPAPTRVNETIAVSPSTAVTLTNGSTRDYTATGLGTSAADIALEPCSNVTTASGNTQFANVNTNTIADGTRQPATPPAGPPDDASSTASITAVNGTPTPTDGAFHKGAAPTNGSITFTITGPSGANAQPVCVVPVVFIDANTDNALNSATTNPAAPTEAFGTGGSTQFAPASAAASTFNVDVQAYTPGSTSFSGCDFVAEGPSGDVVNSTSCHTYGFDAGDSYQLAPSTPITMAEFQTRLSLDDEVAGTYAPGGQSTFVLSDDSPKPPTAVTASRSNATPTSVTISWTAPNTAGSSATTSGYRVYRAQATSCPIFASGQYSMVSPGTITPTSFTDTNAAAALDYCYAVTTVDHTDESDATAPVAVGSVPVFASSTTSTNHTTITLTYNKLIQCSTVDIPGATDYSVTQGTTAASPLSATCSGQTANTVTLTFSAPLDASKVITVTAKAGSDGDTVKDVSSSQQPVGDSIEAGDRPVFVSSASADGSPTITLTYNELITCTSVDLGDYTLTVNGTDISPTTAPYTVSCVAPTNGASAKVAITFTNPTANHFVKGQKVTVTAKAGTDNNTVLDVDENRPQPVGDHTSTTVS